MLKLAPVEEGILFLIIIVLVNFTISYDCLTFVYVRRHCGKCISVVFKSICLGASYHANYHVGVLTSQLRVR